MKHIYILLLAMLGCLSAQAVTITQITTNDTDSDHVWLQWYAGSEYYDIDITAEAGDESWTTTASSYPMLTIYAGTNCTVDYTVTNANTGVTIKTGQVTSGKSTKLSINSSSHPEITVDLTVTNYNEMSYTLTIEGDPSIISKIFYSDETTVTSFTEGTTKMEISQSSLKMWIYTDGGALNKVELNDEEQSLKTDVYSGEYYYYFTINNGDKVYIKTESDEDVTININVTEGCEGFITRVKYGNAVVADWSEPFTGKAGKVLTVSTDTDSYEFQSLKVNDKTVATTGGYSSLVMEDVTLDYAVRKYERNNTLSYTLSTLSYWNVTFAATGYCWTYIMGSGSLMFEDAEAEMSLSCQEMLLMDEDDDPDDYNFMVLHNGLPVNYDSSINGYPFTAADGDTLKGDIQKSDVYNVTYTTADDYAGSEPVVTFDGVAFATVYDHQAYPGTVITVAEPVMPDGYLFSLSVYTADGGAMVAEADEDGVYTVTINDDTTFTFCSEEQEQDSLTTIEAAVDAASPVYNLQGVRVANPQHGLYIQAGRKVIL